MGHHFAPENTLAGLRASFLLGVDIVETDVRLTEDDVVVAFHDSELDRMTDGEGRLSRRTLAEVRRLSVMADPDRYDGDFSCELETKGVSAGIATARSASAAFPSNPTQ